MTDSITFILNGQLQTVTDLPPTTTVLQYLRMHKNLTGTKEGCAEGDCGACTVIIGTKTDHGAQYKTVNACILFLPVLDGRDVITVEHLQSSTGNLTPVQQEMINCHGSQCGFCTPGFVMSLSCLSHNNASPSDDDIHDAIAGNLCRCTGYRPIIEAAHKACAHGPHKLPVSANLDDLQRDRMFQYQAQGKKFFAPVTMNELEEILAQHPEATILAGGTDIGLWVTKKHRDLTVLVYTGNVKDLKQLRQTDNGLEIGAAVPYAEALHQLARYDVSLGELLRRLGSVQIRNSGTVGGNIANGSPIGDGMPPLIALKARLILRSISGKRSVALEDFFIEYGKQDLNTGEFVEKVIVPPKSETTLFKTYKVSKRFDQDISAVCGGFSLDMDGNTIREARLAYGGMAGTPMRAKRAEKALEGRTWGESALEAAMAAIADDFTPLSDMRASAEYRCKVAQNLLARFYAETTDPRIKTQVYRYAG